MNFTFFRLLSQIYSAAVQGVLSGIKCYSCTTSATKVRRALILKLILHNVP